jgi:glycerate 2-kinase
MKLIVATDSFKGSLSAKKACSIIADTISEKCPDVRIIVKPMADGGEGTADAMIAACGGQWITQNVMGPLPEMEVEAGFAWFEDSRTVLVEMACASGITLLPSSYLDPMKTTTYGTGQLIKSAIEKQPNDILLAIGGSATVDAGVGAAMALGWEFTDDQCKPIGPGGGEIERIRDIIRPLEKITCKVKVLSDVDNPLYGPNGAAQIFGPQKGATPEMVKKLDQAIRKFSDLIEGKLDIDVSSLPGAGAAGGLGGGAVAFMNAEIVSGIDVIMNVVNLEKDLRDADWIITGEGRLDNQSFQGKVISGITQLAKQTNTRVAVIAGDIQLDSSSYSDYGIVDAVSLKQKNMTTEYAIQNCQLLLKEACETFLSRHINR